MAADEALEQPVAQLGGDPGPVVLDLEQRAVLRLAAARRRACPAGVWTSAFWIRLSTSRWRSSAEPSTITLLVGVHLELVALGERRGLAGRLAHDGRQVHRLARRLAAGVGAREQQQVGDQPAHPLRRAQRRSGDLAVLALELRLEQLEVGQDARERRAQLVRGVGDELALARERALGLGVRLVQLPEHVVERARQVGDLVVGAQRAAGRPRGRASSRRGGRSRSGR